MTYNGNQDVKLQHSLNIENKCDERPEMADCKNSAKSSLYNNHNHCCDFLNRCEKQEMEIVFSSSSILRDFRVGCESRFVGLLRVLLLMLILLLLTLVLLLLLLLCFFKLIGHPLHLIYHQMSSFKLLTYPQF